MPTTQTIPESGTLPAGTKFVVDIAGTTNLVDKSLLPTGASVATTKALLKGNNSGAAIAVTRTAVADTNYSVLTTDTYVGWASLSAARVPTLPAANTFPVGTPLVICDESGSCSVGNTLTITRAGADTIDGATTLVLNTAYGFAVLFSDGVSKWTYLRSYGTGLLGDPGSNAIIKRTALNVTAAAVAGTDFVAPVATRSIFKGDNLGNLIAMTRTVVGDASVTATAADTYIGFNANLTAPRTATLPAANAYPVGVPLVIADEFGGITATNTITIARAGADTIQGATSVVLNAAFDKIILFSDGTSKWSFVKQANIATTRLPLKGDNAGHAVAQVIQQIGDTSATINAGTNVVLLTTAFTAPRTMTLPASAGYTVGDPSSILFLDPKGCVSGTNTLSVLRAGADTVNGAAAAVVLMNAPRQLGEVFLDATGTNWGAVTPSGGQVQLFTANGTWTKPTGSYTTARVICIGGGGGGGSGRKGATGANRGGGGGGGGAGFADQFYAFADLPSSVAVTVPAAAAGGAAQATNSTDGSPGAVGGAVSFGTILSAAGGNFGAAGTSAAGGTPGQASIGGNYQGASGTAGGFGTAGSAQSGWVGAAFTGALCAGGGGGGGSTAAAFQAGAAGIQAKNNFAGGSAPAGGATDGANGANGANPGGANSPQPGSSGAGGASSILAAGGNGGSGGYGAGGGGGGSSQDAVGNSGPGGAGGVGLVYVACF